MGSPAVLKTAAPKGHRSSNLLPSANFFPLGCSWESRRIPIPPHGVRIVARVPVESEADGKPPHCYRGKRSRATGFDSQALRQLLSIRQIRHSCGGL
jgi:hypothetical protein